MALKFKVVISALAADNLDDIHGFIYNQYKDMDAADRVVGRITAYIKRNLAFNPFIGRILFEYKLKTKDVRRITVEKRYNIFYRVDEQAQEVYIIKIADGRQGVKHQLLGL